jgi:putative Ca2+/H+ antiporter (TMEM165/GDT1 family)
MTWLDDLTNSTGGQHRAGLVSFVIILVSEIGDKTFFIAAIMAMVRSLTLIPSLIHGSLFSQQHS